MTAMPVNAEVPATNKAGLSVHADRSAPKVRDVIAVFGSPSFTVWASRAVHRPRPA